MRTELDHPAIRSEDDRQCSAEFVSWRNVDHVHMWLGHGSDARRPMRQLSTTQELDQMHALYRQGGSEHRCALHIVYASPTCPHVGCGEPMQAIDFRLEDHGRAVHDPLVRAWWNDTGFVGRCPHCGGWIHFTIRSKQAITADEAARAS